MSSTKPTTPSKSRDCLDLQKFTTDLYLLNFRHGAPFLLGKVDKGHQQIRHTANLVTVSWTLIAEARTKTLGFAGQMPPALP